MKTIYEFHGGKLNKQRFTRAQVEEFSDGITPDLSAARATGALVKRAELDSQPVVPGYLGPMWDGLRYVDENGKEFYDFMLPDEQKQGLECFAVLRYETQQVYDILSR